MCKEDFETIYESIDVLSKEGFPESCIYFIPKERFVQVPNDDAIIFVKDNWLMLNFESEHLGEAIKRSVDYLIKNAKERDRE